MTHSRKKISFQDQISGRVVVVTGEISESHIQEYYILITSPSNVCLYSGDRGTDDRRKKLWKTVFPAGDVHLLPNFPCTGIHRIHAILCAFHESGCFGCINLPVLQWNGTDIPDEHIVQFPKVEDRNVAFVRSGTGHPEKGFGSCPGDKKRRLSRPLPKCYPAIARAWIDMRFSRQDRIRYSTWKRGTGRYLCSAL